MKSKILSIWVLTLGFLIGAYFLTNGTQLYKVISVVDMFIYFIYISIFFNIILIVINLFVMYHVSAITALPSFLTNNFIVEMGAETLKEKGFDKVNEFGGEKLSKVSEKLDKFKLFPVILRLFASILALMISYYLVGTYFVENVTLNLELISLLMISLSFIGYYFYEQTNKYFIQRA